jgi:uroporphyrinogen decarboxylase
MSTLTSTQRLLTAISHQEPDRVPLILTLTLHGAKEVGLSLPEYFRSTDNLVEGQLRLHQKYGHDALMGFQYGALEYEAWGGEAIFTEDGPPNSAEPLLKNLEGIKGLKVPRIEDCPKLQRTLDLITALKARVGDEVPVLGVVLSPFSFPVMQLGFDHYIDALYERRDLFWQLMDRNIHFAQAWANAQLEAGALAVVYFDPLASPSMLPREIYENTGLPVALQTLAGIQGPTVTHLASGLTLDVIDLLAQTGTLAIGISCREDLGKVRERTRSRMAVLGNLNGVAMIDWTPQEAEEAVRQALAAAGPGGGFLLGDNHGEIPWQVPDSVLTAVAEAAHTWGTYPLKAAEAHA